MDEKYAKHVDEILSAVGDAAGREDIEKEFRNYVEEFRLSVLEAKKLIARKHGATLTFSSEPTKKTVGELTNLDNNVDMLCRVVFVSEKTITSDGEEKVILSGILVFLYDISFFIPPTKNHHKRDQGLLNQYPTHSLTNSIRSFFNLH